MHRFLVGIVLFGTALLFLSGCSSIRTRMWTRDETETLHTDNCQHLRGVPVMLKVPSHLEITIVEHLYAAHAEGRLEIVKLRRPDLEAFTELKYTEKMFLVDPVHVLAGSGAYGFGFAKSDMSSRIPNANGDDGTGHGYLHDSHYQADDQSITTIASLIANVAGVSRARKSATGPPGMNLTTIDRVVAFRRFDLATPNIDQEVQAFLDEQLNQSHAGDGAGMRAFADPNIVVPNVFERLPAPHNNPPTN